jgi:hypothetical protein
MTVNKVVECSWKVKKESLNSMRTIASVLSIIRRLVIIAGSAIASFLIAFGLPYGIYYEIGPKMIDDILFSTHELYVTF